jgi:uncharacterized membrane protein (UPF0127 family)
MKLVTITNKRNNKLIGNKIGSADNFVSRFFGLMRKKNLNEQEGLLINPCNSIHMMFMKFPLDIIFLDKQSKIVHLIEGLKPWRVSPVILKSQSVIELPEGTISKSESRLDDVLEII